jgi:hypothetical protein
MNERLKELAVQAGLQNTLGCFWQSGDHDLERFAELVRDDERKGCAEHYLEIMRDAVAREREACAVLVEGGNHVHPKAPDAIWAKIVAKLIRVRGEK